LARTLSIRGLPPSRGASPLYWRLPVFGASDLLPKISTAMM